MRNKTRHRLAQEQAAKKPSIRATAATMFKTLGGKSLPGRPLTAALGGIPTVSPRVLPIAALEARTPDQIAILEASKFIVDLTAKQIQVQKLLAAMSALRQGYAVAYLELQRLVETAVAGTPAENMAGVYTDYAVQITSYEAAKPFDEHVLINGLFHEVFPTLTDVVVAHQEADEAEEAAAAAVAEKARRARRIPIGVTYSTAQDEPGLSRDRSLVLVGWRPAVLWLLDQITKTANDSAVAADCRVLRLRVNDHDLADSEQLWLNSVCWAKCTNTERSFAEFLIGYVNPLMPPLLDLVIIDDLSLANSTGFIGRARGATAGDAHRRFREWANIIGTAVVAAVPLESQNLADLESPAYDQLKTFTYLRPVRILQDETVPDDHYRISVADHASVFDVPKSVLDAYEAPRILIPAGVVT